MRVSNSIHPSTPGHTHTYMHWGTFGNQLEALNHPLTKELKLVVEMLPHHKIPSKGGPPSTTNLPPKGGPPPTQNPALKVDLSKVKQLKQNYHCFLS